MILGKKKLSHRSKKVLDKFGAPKRAQFTYHYHTFLYTVHVSGFGHSKAKTHLNIRKHYIKKDWFNEKIICLLEFGKISSSFNDVGYLPGHAFDQ